jgi:hypothetical protein
MLEKELNYKQNNITLCFASEFFIIHGIKSPELQEPACFMAGSQQPNIQPTNRIFIL